MSEKRLKLSDAQPQLQALNQSGPEGSPLNLCIKLRLTGELDRALLERSLEGIINRHEALWGSFDGASGTARQSVWPTLTPILKVIDLRHVPDVEHEKQILAIAGQEAGTPFNLTRDPLLRSSLIRFGEKDYVLLMILHQIGFDVSSVRIIIGELALSYEAFASGKDSSIAEPSLRYGDFVRSQRESLQDGRLARELSYWKQQLNGAPALLELPTDRPRSATKSFTTAKLGFGLSSVLTGSLKTLCQQEGKPLSVILLAAFKTLLYRYSRQQDILVGTNVDCRMGADTEDLIGPFANTVGLRTDLSGSITFRDLLARVAAVAEQAWAHPNIPFKTLIDELHSEQSLSHKPVMQVMFALDEVPRTPLQVSGVTFQLMSLDSSAVNYDLMLSLWQAEERLIGSLEYNSALFEAATAKRITGHFETLLEAIASSPEQLIADIPILTQAERDQLLVDWNDTARDYPRDNCIHQLFEAQVERSPHATAIIAEDGQLTYDELNCRANQLAHYLKELGVGPEVFVGVCLERSIEMVVAMLGILKAGGAYIPLDPVYPTDRLAFMIKDGPAAVLLTQQRLLELLPDHTAMAVCLDSDWGMISTRTRQNPRSRVIADNVAYSIYTSGSTGKPKGIAIQHQTAVTMLYWSREVFTSAEFGGMLASTSICFDMSVFELFATLSWGGKIILADNALQLPALRAADHVVLIDTVPSAMAELLRVNGVPNSARTVNLGGEALSDMLVQRILELEQVDRVINLYGPSEDTTFTTFALMEKAQFNRSTVGRPLANTQIFVLDSRLQPVPIGVPGEVYIGGGGLTRGYLNHPEMTAEKFIPNPFSLPPGARMYKTGDLARYLPDSNIDYLGRIDHQVKIRGFRVELGEIEATLEQHPSVRASVVLVREDAAGDKRLVAYITFQGQAPPSTSELRELLSKHLPVYMIPSAFVFLDAMPLTPNGKVDRRALPAPDQSRPDLEGPLVSPRTQTERMLTSIWQEILRLESVGIHDNFFDLGGHSLLATQFISRVRDECGVELSLREIFFTPTIADIAGSMDRRTGREQGPEAFTLHPIPREGDLPVSFSQERVWFVQQLNPASLAYNFQATIRLQGELAIEKLEQALSEIVRRHEIWRTTFLEKDGRVIQVIHEARPLSLPLIDLQVFPESERETEARRVIGAELKKLFDLTELPLVRWILLRFSAQDHLLLHVEHHIVHDGWSFNIFLNEMATLYNAFSTGNQSALAEMAIQFADFAHWQRQWMQGEVAAKQLDYWKQRLAGCPTLLNLPLDHPRPPAQTFRGAAPRVELPLTLCNRLRVLSRQQGSTLFMTMFAAFLTLLHRYSGETDICVGSGIANRRWSETESLIGMIINNLVLRNDLSGNPTFRALLEQVRKVTLDAYANQDVPFDKVVEALHPQRDFSYNPLYQVMFAFHDSPLSDLEMLGLDLTLTEAISNQSAKWDFSLIVIPRGEQQVGRSKPDKSEAITMIWEYNSDLFDEATIKRLIQYYQTLLEGITADPDGRIGDLRLLSEAESRQLECDWNHTARPFPANATLHELFAQQVALHPCAIALVTGASALSYAQLNARANQLAHLLRAKGIGPESVVGLCLKRSPQMVLAMLGVLKAGGAYLPLDPAYPAQRLAFMIADSEAKVVIGQAGVADKLAGVEAEVMDWEEVSLLLEQESAEETRSEAGGANLAYVIYTSGSTGMAKGVGVTHSNVVKLVEGADYVELSEETVMPHMAAVTFDAATFEVWGGLLKGGKVVVVEQQASLEEIADLIDLHRINTMFITTSLFHQMVDHYPRQLAQVEQLMAGGEAMSTTHAQRFLAGLGACKFCNIYGPTENTTFTARCELANSANIEASVPIGKPISNTEVYVLDHNLKLCPVGAPGQLFIGGAGLARGYFNRAELTAERFIPHPLAKQAGERLYQSGDLVRYLADGNLEFLGRVDQQVKVRGFRIEPGEVEAALRECRGVQECVVMGVGQGGEKRLVGYVKVAGAEVSGVEVKRELSEKVPDYMVPSVIVVVEEMVLNASGKIDRGALPAPDPLGTELNEMFVSPRTPIEQTLADIWAEVLRVEQVGIFDNFFDLGGHSLLATQILSRVRNACQVKLPLASFFEAPTVAKLAQTVEAMFFEHLANLSDEDASRFAQ